MKLQKIPKEFRVEYSGDELGFGILVSGINTLQDYINMIIDHINEHEKPKRLTKHELEVRREALELEKMIEERMEKAQERLKAGGGKLA